MALQSFNNSNNNANAELLASALSALTGSQVITQSEYLHQAASNGNNANYQNISLLSLHNSYLSGADSNFPNPHNPHNPHNLHNFPNSPIPPIPLNSLIPQQNNQNNNENISCFSLTNNYCHSQQIIYFVNSQIISYPNIPFQTPSPNNYLPSISNNLQQNAQQFQQQISQDLQNSTTISINIETLNGKIIPINNVPIIAKISVIKFYIENKTRIPSYQQRLIYSGIHLKDNLTLLDYNILNNNSTIHLIGQILGDVISFIDSEFLDPMYDCDFTNINDNNIRFMRGSHEYRRPCGWKRIAVKVLNKYGDNAWLGKAAKKGSWRYESDPNEWPVSYHGTNKFNAKSIAETGFDITKGKRFKFGPGIYSTPDINIAALYANTFKHNNEDYCLVFQNRVNPETLVKIPTNIGEYWISPKSDDIRPYGICIKKLLPRN